MQELEQNKCNLCYGYGKNRPVYMNPKCGHKYCKQCICNRFVPDQSTIQCFVRTCFNQINVDEMDDYFIQIQIQQFNEAQTEQNDTVPIETNIMNGKKYDQIKLDDHNKPLKDKEQIACSQEKKNKLASEIKKQKQSDTAEYCGCCLMQLINKIEEKKTNFCKIHLLCFACHYKEVFQKKKQKYNNYNYQYNQYNYSNQTIDCQICNRWPGSHY